MKLCVRSTIRYIVNLCKMSSISQALELCSHYNLTDYFLDSCMFDLMTTGDSYFRQAAAAAQLDLWTQDPQTAASTLRNCTRWPCEWQAASSAADARAESRFAHAGVMATLLLVVFVLHSHIYAASR